MTTSPIDTIKTESNTIPNWQKVRTSKFMAWLLRHGLNDRSIKYNNEGYILVDELLKQPEMKDLKLEDLHSIVDTNDKKRFSLKKVNDVYYICANQGHSKDVGDKIKDDDALTPITSAFPMCIHGTNKNAWLSIQKTGLLPMDRKHIHFAAGLPDDASVISGMRSTSKVIIHIDTQKAIDKGKKFYISSNNVILTSDCIEPELFSKVVFK